MNKKFIDEYGQELFEKIFFNIYGDCNDENITVDKQYRDRECLNSFGTVSVAINDGELNVEFVDGNSNGSEIINYYFS